MRDYEGILQHLFGASCREVATRTWAIDRAALCVAVSNLTLTDLEVVCQQFGAYPNTSGFIPMITERMHFELRARIDREMSVGNISPLPVTLEFVQSMFAVVECGGRLEFPIGVNIVLEGGWLRARTSSNSSTDTAATLAGMERAIQAINETITKYNQRRLTKAA